MTIAVEMITVEAIASSVDPGRRELTPSRHSVRSTGWPLVIISNTIHAALPFSHDEVVWLKLSIFPIPVSSVKQPTLGQCCDGQIG